MRPCKFFSHIQVLVTYSFPIPPIKPKPGLQIGGRLLTATHLDESNSLTNQKGGTVNKYDLTVFIRLIKGSSRALSESCAFFQSHSNLPVDLLDFTAVPHPRIPVQDHVLSAGGDALSIIQDLLA
jgi:hypothetical protein